MIYPTPAADFNGVAAGLRLMEAAVDLIAIADDQPAKKAEYLQESANLVKDAWMALQVAAGRALQEEEDEKESAGLTRCIRCREWKPREETVLLSSRPEAKKTGKASHWTECRVCLGRSFHLPILDENEVVDLFEDQPEVRSEPNLFEDGP